MKYTQHKEKSGPINIGDRFKIYINGEFGNAGFANGSTIRVEAIEYFTDTCKYQERCRVTGERPPIGALCEGIISYTYAGEKGRMTRCAKYFTEKYMEKLYKEEMI